MNIRTTFQYKLKESMKSALTFFGVLALILLFMITWIGVLQSDNSGSSSFFSGYTIGAAIMMLVIGICSIREDLRLFIQNGVGRKTTYSTEILSAIAISFMLAIGGQIFLGLGHVVASNFPEVYVSDLYPLIYADGTNALTLLQHIESTFLSVALFMMMFLCGEFFSLLFYILSKKWTIVVSIALPLLLFGGVPTVALRFPEQAVLFGHFAAQSSWNLSFVFLVVAVIAAGIDWMIVRKVHIKGL